PCRCTGQSAPALPDCWPTSRCRCPLRARDRCSPGRGNGRCQSIVRWLRSWASLFAIRSSLFARKVRSSKANSEQRAALVLVVNCVLVLRTLQTDGKVLLGLIDRVIVSKGLKSRGDDLHPQHSVRQAICFGPTLGIRLELNSAFGLLAVTANRMQDHCGVAHGLAVVVLENNKLYRGRLAGRLILITGSEQSGNHEQDKKDREQWARYLHDPCILGNRTARRNAIGFRRTGPSTSSIPKPFSNTCLETILWNTSPRKYRTWEWAGSTATQLRSLDELPGNVLSRNSDRLP